MLSNQIKEQNLKIDKLSKDNKALNERVKSLESQINKNSNNSSKSPSSDGFKNYYKYTKCNHGLCNAHILRELNGITELQGQNWAKPMKNLLLEIKN